MSKVFLKKKYRRAFCSFLCNLSLVLNIFLPYLAAIPAYAQEADLTPTPVIENTPTPEVFPTSEPTPTIEITPTSEPTLIPLEVPTLTPEPVSPTLEPTITDTPENNQPVENNSSPSPVDTVTPTSTPTSTPVDNAVCSITPTPIVSTEINKVFLEAGDAVRDSVELDWNYDINGDFYVTREKVKLGIKYIFPQDNNVTVTFTSLPQDEIYRSYLKIKQVKTSDLKLPENVGNVGEYAYDITTDMFDGQFTYDITLPKNPDQTAEISYIEKTLDQAKNGITANEINSIDESKLEQQENSVKVFDVDHFTIFIVTGVWPTTSNNSIVSGEGTSQIRWPDGPGEKSGLGFTGVSGLNLETLTSSGSAFILGTLTHYNHPVNKAIIWADLKITLGLPTPKDFTFRVQIDETENNGSCPYGGSGINCNDKVTFPDSISDQIVTVGGVDYTLIIDGFKKEITGTTLDSFITEENKDNVAYLVGHFTPVGRIIVDKVTIPSADATSFSFTTTGAGYNSFSLKDTDTPNNQILPANKTYSVGESLPTNWSQSSANCVSSIGDTETVSSLELDPGETITCTFTNTSTACHAGTPSLEGQVKGSGYTTGNLCSGSGDCWSEGDNVPARLTIPGVSVGGTYSVTIQHDYSLDGTIGYENFNSATSGNSSANNITLSPATDVDCGGGVTCKNYVLSFTALSSTVQLDWLAKLSNQAGAWSGASLHYRLVLGPCGGAGNKDIPINPGKIVIKGSITPIKSTLNGVNPANWKFNLTGNTPITNIDSGTKVENLDLNANNGDALYTISEIGSTAWILDSVSGDCQKISDTSATVTLTSAKPDVSCTFINKAKNGSLIVQKTTTPTTDPTNFFITLSDGQTGVVSDANDQIFSVIAGTYSVTENILAGWAQTSNTCTNVSVAAGETKYCTIENKKLPTLIVEKVLIGESAPYSNFSFMVDGGATTPFESDGNNQIYLVPDSAYNITETDPGSDYHVSYSAGCRGNLTYNQTATCTITNTKYASLTIVKNANPHSSQSFGFTTSGVGLSNFSLSDDGSVFGGNTVTFSHLLPGIYSVTENSVASWDSNVSCSDKSPNTAIDLSAGENITCTFDNTMRGTIGGHKFNDLDGDPATTDDQVGVSGWTIELWQNGNLLNSTLTSGSNGTYAFNNLIPGEYELREALQVGWISLYPTSAKLSVTLGPGENNYHYDFINTAYASVTVYKDLDTDGDGRVDDSHVSTWTWDLNDKLNNPTGSTIYSLNPGAYTLSEDQQNGYHVSSLICNNGPDGSVNNYGAVESQNLNLSSGQKLICTFTNTRDTGTLRVVKNLINDNGGLKNNSDFSFKVNNGPDQSFESDGTNDYLLPIGKYSVVENPTTGYGISYDNCTNVNVLSNQITTCTITNNDLAPSLHLRKNITNLNGGTAKATDWTLTASGPSLLQGSTPVDSDQTLKAGTYVLSESGPLGYTSSAWSCSGGIQDGNNITLSLGEDVTCTITNDDNVPSLTLIKNIINDNGGTASAPNWVLTATGPSTLSGNGSVSSGLNFQAGTYILTESSDIPGYSAGNWSCVKNGSDPYSTASITLELGDIATCTITNDDIAPSLILNKTVINDQGGNNSESDWTLRADGGQAGYIEGLGTSGDIDVQSGSKFQAGTYNLSELGTPSGYQASNWSCSVNGQRAVEGSVLTLALADKAICTITNDDIAPTLKVIKNVVNDHGGNAQIADFNIKLNDTLLVFDSGSPSGATTTYIATPTVSANNSYTLSEADLSGYEEGAWSCLDNSTGAPIIQPFTLNEGQNVVCTITNDDIAPKLTLVKNVVNDNGGLFNPDDFYLTVGSSLVSSGVKNTYAANTAYIINETPSAAYEFVNITGDAKCPQNLGDTITLDEGDDITCTITNNDIYSRLTVYKFNDLNANGVHDDAEPYLSNWTVNLSGQSSVNTNTDGQVSFDRLIPGTYQLDENLQENWYQSGIYCEGQGTRITATGEAYGHHGDCQGWNGYDAATLAQWACEVKGYNYLVSYGAQKPCTQFNNCNLFWSQGSVQYNWGNWCEVMGVTDIVCSKFSSSLGGSSSYDAVTDSLSLTLAPSQRQTCYIGNYQKANITVNKNVLSFDGTDIGDTSSFTLDAGQVLGVSSFSEDNPLSFTVDPGTYTFNEINIPENYELYSENNQSVTVTSGGRASLTFVNKQNPPPSATISKSNNALASGQAPGSSVAFKIKIIISDNNINDFQVTDLMSNGFVYHPGSYQVVKNGSDITSSITEPQYHSPGVWSLGNLHIGDTLEMSYLADISSDQQAGKYNDLAYAYGQTPFGDHEIVYASGQNSTYVNNNFVGTEVPVVKSSQNTVSTNVEKHEQGKVLGVSTELPATGSSAFWLIIGIIALILGAYFIRKSLKVLFVLFTLFPLFALPAKAANPLSVRLEQPKSPINTNDLKLTFVALEINGVDPITVRCFKKAPSDSTYSQYGSDISLNAPGNTGQCANLSSIISSEGTYLFYVTANADSSGIVAVDYKTSGPSTPGDYRKEHPNNCDYKIHFKTADDSGKTTKVEVYRSDKTSFDLNDGTIIAGIPIGSNQEYEITNSVPDCAKTYYYALRAFDDAGNGSGIVGDSITITTTTTTVGTTTVSSAIPVVNVTLAKESTLTPGSEITPSPVTEEGSVLGVQNAPLTFLQKYWLALLLTALLVIIALIYVLKRNRQYQ